MALPKCTPGRVLPWESLRGNSQPPRAEIPQFTIKNLHFVIFSKEKNHSIKMKWLYQNVRPGGFFHRNPYGGTPTPLEPKSLSSLSKTYTSLLFQNKKATPSNEVALPKCTPGRVRTSNPQSRNLVLYPVELRAHFCKMLVYSEPKSMIWFLV